MRVLGAVALAAAFFASSAIAASAQELAAILPPCALGCMKSSLAEASCAPTDQECLCLDPGYTAALEECVMATCTIRQSLVTKNVTTQGCHAPIRDRTKVVSYTGVGGGIIAFIAFVLRMIARLKCCGGMFGMDDYTMILAMGLTVALSALSVVLADAGLGRDMWTIPLDNITRILYIYFWDELMYLSILPLTKISICCFYLRIFPERRFRTVTYIMIGINVCYLLVFVLISVFQCLPVDGAWLHWDGEGNYKCNNINAQGWSSAIINMALDILVMALPLRQLYHLNLSARKKIYVMCMFSLGIFVTLVSILRLRSLIVFASTENLSWDYVSVGYWSTVECDVGIICACLPAIRSLLCRVLPGAFGDTNPSKPYGASSRSQSRVDGKAHVQIKNDNREFYPLEDIDHSSETALGHHGA
ncbi:hypothetical protein N7468_010661 [Penicillium chermesinum]|uniref:CFEM domain-containing protein n=1 Tax=Penicillium chermesinum TaxID=63820 RepID=A0A9W9T9X7_9EURO|nr:uncharacterized protein N7468_010661 [Penicillium chermesinum]KAJ5214982.1 hypothetical protein N7468_010661 [Penicillium chermesinum]KAJ6141517.1 hypothetical protein N7470_009907 [Penicillium chermesinum]